MERVLDRYITTSPTVRGGRPHIAGTRLTVADIALMYTRRQLSEEAIAKKYGLLPAAVYEALSYYYSHQAQIDQSIAEDEVFAREFQRTHPSPLQRKLKP
jgi:uncharacterized protein (DUF433 family)